MFRLLPLAFLGMATITTSGIVALAECSIVKSLSCFRCPRPEIQAKWDPVTQLHGDAECYDACSDVGVPRAMGAPPSTVGTSSKMGTSSTLPCIKRTSGKKELGSMSCAPAVSHVSGAARTVVVLVPAATPVTRLLASFCRVIRVHTRVGDVDKGVRRDRGAASVGRPTGAAMAPGPTDGGTILCGAEAG
jgi:hypothetical protein